MATQTDTDKVKELLDLMDSSPDFKGVYDYNSLSEALGDSAKSKELYDLLETDEDFKGAYKSPEDLMSLKKKEFSQPSPLVKPVQDFSPSATGPLKDSFQLPSQSSSGLKEFEKRILNPSDFIQNSDGSRSTHKMASANVDGKEIAFPTIVKKDGKLVELSVDDAIDFAIKNNEYKEFKTSKEAQEYAEGGYKKGSPLQEPTGIPKFDTPSPFKQDDSWRVPMVPDKDMIIGTDEQGNEISVNPKAELEKRLDKYRVPVYARTADSPDAGGIYFNESLVDESISKIEKIDKDLEFLSSVHHPSYKEINRLKDEREALNQVISKNNISKIDALKRESGAAYTIDGVPVNFSVMYAKSFDPDFITSVKEGKSNIGVQNDDELSTHFNTQVKNVGAWSDPVESFVSGVAGIGAGVAHLPDFLWQSIYTLGSGGKIGKVPQAENPLRDKLSAVSDEYAAKQFQYKDGILESLKNGNVADAVKQTTNAVSGSLPYTGLAAATGGLGVVPSGLIMTGVSASQKNLDGTANEVDAATELVYDWLSVAAESGGELITQKILFKQIDSYSKNAKKLYKEALKTGSKEAADAYIKELSEQSAKNIVKDVAKNTRTSMTEEGLSEAATAVAQGIFGNITGAEPQSASQIVNNAIESAIVGSVSGGGMAQVGNIGLTSAAITSIGDRNKLRDLNREIELLGDKILASDVDNATKVRLMKMAKDKRHEQLNIIRDNRAKAEAMSEESRQAINEAAIERRDIEGLVSTADEELKPVLEGRMAELDKKISEMVTQAEVGVPKEQYPATEIQKGDIVAGDVFENQPTNVTNAIELFGKTPEEITRIQDMYGRGYDLTMGGIREYFKDKEANQLKPITRPLVPKKESPKPKAQPKPIKDEKQEVGMQEARGQEETEVLTESKYDQQIDQLVASGNISQDQSSAVKSVLKPVFKSIANISGLSVDEVLSKHLSGIKASKKPSVGGKFQYVGQKGDIGADLQSNLNRAIGMESKGATANDIRKETGWFKGKYDGKWRYEINPVQVTPVGEKRLLDAANASRDNKTVELVRLKDVIEDSELLKLYPELENTKIAFYDSESEAGYSFVDGVGYISLNPKTYFQKGYGQDRAKWVHRNIAHELQHAVQLLEGFARGTSSKEVSDMLRRSAPEPQRGLPLPADVVYSVYSRFAGEIEARDVQERSTLTQEQRLEKQPFTSEDISVENAIILTPEDYESQKRGGVVKGGIENISGSQSKIIHLFESGDMSTLIHEHAHLFRDMLYWAAENAKDDAARSDAQNMIDALNDFVGAESANWSLSQDEKFASAFEKYFYDGVAPSKELEGVFAQIKGWMIEIYSSITGSEIDIEIPDNVRSVFDKLLTQKTEQDAVQEQKPDEGVLRQEGSEVELLQVEQGDSKQEITAQQGEAVQEEVKPKAAPTSPMAARLAGFAKPATEPKAAEVRPEPSPTVSKKETVKQPTTLEERIAAAKGETIGKKVDKTAQKLSEIAAKIRGGKLDNDTMMSGIPFSKQVWNGAIEVAAKAIESGASVLRAINRAIFWLNSQTWYQKLTKSNQSKAQAQLVNYLAGHTGTNPMADDMDIFIAKQSEYIANKEKTSAQDWIDALNNNLLDKRGKVKRLLKKIGATEAITRRTLSAGASSLAKERLKEYKTRVFGGLNVLEKELLNNVIQFRRIIELDNDKDSKGEPRLKHSTVDESGRKISPNKEGAEAWLAKFESTDREMYDKLNERATDYFAINKELLKERLDDGMLTQDQYDALSKLDYSKRAYVDRLFELEMLKNYSGVTSDEIKALKEGSEMMLYNNAEWLLEQNTVGTIRALFENRANRALGEFIKNNPGNGIFEYQAPIGVNSVTGEPKFKEPQVGQDQIKYRDENGVTRSIIGPSEIVEQWRGTEPILKQDVAKAVSWVSLAKPLKLFATGINPVFALSNIPRDMAHAMHFTDTYSSLMPVATAQMAKDMATVAFDAFKRKGRYIDALKEGMGMDYLTTQSKVITEGGDSPTAKAIQKLQDIAGFLNETSEIITRLAVREREIQKGLPSYQATAKARAYMDFSEGGRLTKAADTAIPYLNAATQGLRVSARAFKEKPVVTTFKIVQLMTASAALALYNMGYDDEDEKNGVIGRKHISDFVKSSNQIVMAPWTVEKDGVMVRPYFTIPITQDARPFKSLAETMIEFNKKGVFNQNQMKHSLADFVPITDVPVPPIYDAVSTYQANYDSFTDEQVWKGGDVEAKEEYKLGKTPKLYIDIGELTGMSPDRLRAASGKILTSDKSNIYTIALREGWEGATTGMDPVMKRNYSKEMDERVKSIMGPFSQKFYRYPSEREFNKNLIEQEKIKENTKRKIEEKNVVQDYVNQYWKASADKKEDLKDQFDKWAKSLDDDAEVRAKRTFKNMTKTEGVKDRFLIDLMYTDAPNAAKASSFYLKMESMPKRDRAEFYKAAKSAGIFTEGFTDEYSKVKKQRGVLEMD